jgi:hypothetical protein
VIEVAQEVELAVDVVVSVATVAAMAVDAEVLAVVEEGPEEALAVVTEAVVPPVDAVEEQALEADLVVPVVAQQESSSSPIASPVSLLDAERRMSC